MLVSLTYEKGTDIEWGKLSDENIVDGYVSAIKNKSYQKSRFFEQELMKRKLFVVALERYDLISF